jgi:hypothetical protein
MLAPSKYDPPESFCATAKEHAAIKNAAIAPAENTPREDLQRAILNMSEMLSGESDGMNRW